MYYRPSGNIRETSDRRIQTIFETLVVLLAGSPASETSTPLLVSMLQLSAILDFNAELFRSGTIEDALARHDLFTAALKLASTFVDISMTRALITKERLGKEYKGSFQDLTLGRVVLGIKADTVSSVHQSMSGLATVCQNLLEAAKAMPKQYKKSTDLLDMCTQITKLANKIDSLGSQEGAGRLDPPRLDPWKKFCRKRCVEHVEDERILSRHYYNGSALKVKSAATNRMKRLVQEIAAMKVSLPEGIFLKVPRSRPDVLKVLIVGP